MHHELLSEEFFSEFYADSFSDCPSSYILVSQKMVVLQNLVLIQAVLVGFRFQCP